MLIFNILEKSRLFLKGRNQYGKEIYVRKIHDLIWVKIDEYGFVELIQKCETRKYIDTIILPKPIRSEEDLNKLIDVLNIN